MFEIPEYMSAITSEEIQKLALNVAELSLAKKRKVGAVITVNGQFVSSGCNYNSAPDMNTCEDELGKTLPSAVHAEVAAIAAAPKHILEDRNLTKTIHVTHQPCDNCLEAIEKAGIQVVCIVSEFMKFDSDKLRYDLIPPSATKALAQVLTYGAKKYKPGNWKNVKDLSRYRDALFRHLEAYRDGEEFDEESGLPHLAHLLTNVAFLVELDKPGEKE